MLAFDTFFFFGFSGLTVLSLYLRPATAAFERSSSKNSEIVLNSSSSREFKITIVIIERVSTSPLPYWVLNTLAIFSSSFLFARLIYVAIFGAICSLANVAPRNG